MSDDEQASYTRPIWRPGAIRKTVIAAAEKLVEYQIEAPPLTFYQALADRAEQIADEAIAEAIDAREDDARTVVANLTRGLWRPPPSI